MQPQQMSNKKEVVKLILCALHIWACSTVQRSVLYSQFLSLVCNVLMLIENLITREITCFVHDYNHRMIA